MTLHSHPFQFVKFSILLTKFVPSSAHLLIYRRLNQAQFTKLAGAAVDADEKKPKIPFKKAKNNPRNSLKTKGL